METTSPTSTTIRRWPPWRADQHRAALSLHGEFEKVHLSSVGRRSTLLHLTVVAFLCSVSYLLSIWHHGGFSVTHTAEGMEAVGTHRVVWVSIGRRAEGDRHTSDGAAS
jgi:hypothetical protein